MEPMEIVEAIIHNKKYKSVDVEKEIDLDYDLGNLLASDPNIIDEDEFRNDSNACMMNIARGNAQLLIAKLFKLPSERVEDVIVAKLPAGTTRLPREKPIPGPKKQTKWEKFAQMKGIQHRKKTRMVYDEQLKEYRPRWGFNRAGDDTKDWCIEVPGNADPNEDQYEKRIAAKKERVAKNELQRLRNVARNTKGKRPGLTMMPTKNVDRDELNVQLEMAKKSTASLGKFTESLPNEKRSKHLGKRHKFESNFGNEDALRQRDKAILDKIRSGQPLVDKDRAANLLQAAEQRARSSESSDKKKHGKDKKFGKSPMKSKKGQNNFKKTPMKSGGKGGMKSGGKGGMKSGGKGGMKSGGKGGMKSGGKGGMKSGGKGKFAKGGNKFKKGSKPSGA